LIIYFSLNRIFNILKTDLQEDFEEDQNRVAALIHLFHSENLETLFMVNSHFFFFLRVLF